MTETMTVHEALCELKTLNKRVFGAIEDSNPVGTKEASAKTISGKPVSERIAKIKADHQSIMDLINRMVAMKAAISEYNARKVITVAGKEMTIAQAIYLHQFGLEPKKALLNKYSKALTGATDYCETANGEPLNRKAEMAMTAVFGSKDKADPAGYLKGLAEFKELHTMELVDPLDLAKVIAKMEEEISSFEVKVDSAIQIANATTTITIEY